MILGELGMEFLNLKDPRFAFADPDSACHAAGFCWKHWMEALNQGAASRHTIPGNQLLSKETVNASIVKFGTQGQHLGVVSARGLQHKAPNPRTSDRSWIVCKFWFTLCNIVQFIVQLKCFENGHFECANVRGIACTSRALLLMNLASATHGSG